MNVQKSSSILRNIKNISVAKTARKAVLPALVSLMTLTATAKNTDSFNYTNKEQVKIEQKMQYNEAGRWLDRMLDLTFYGGIILFGGLIAFTLRMDTDNSTTPRENYLKYRKNVLEDLERTKKVKEDFINSLTPEDKYYPYLSDSIRALSVRIEQYKQIPSEFNPHKKYTREQLVNLKKGLLKELSSVSSKLEDTEKSYKPCDIHEYTIDVPTKTSYTYFWSGRSVIPIPDTIPAHKETHYRDNNKWYNDAVSRSEATYRSVIEYINSQLDKIRKYETKKLK